MASLTVVIMIKASGDTDNNDPPLKIAPGKTWTDISSMAMAKTKTKTKLASAKQGKWQALRKQQPKMKRGGT